MARLVALQLSVLQQSKQVINLDAKGVRTQMEELPFTEVRKSFEHHNSDVDYYKLKVYTQMGVAIMPCGCILICTCCLVIYRICSNISPGFYFLPGSEDRASNRD